MAGRKAEAYIQIDVPTAKDFPLVSLLALAVEFSL
jgi:hypothetical protein